MPLFLLSCSGSLLYFYLPCCLVPSLQFLLRFIVPVYVNSLVLPPHGKLFVWSFEFSLSRLPYRGFLCSINSLFCKMLSAYGFSYQILDRTNQPTLNSAGSYGQCAIPVMILPDPPSVRPVAVGSRCMSFPLGVPGRGGVNRF